MPIRARVIVAVAAPAALLLAALAVVVFVRVRADRIADLDASLVARAAALAAVVERDDAGRWETEPLEPLATGLVGWQVRAHPDGPSISGAPLLEAAAKLPVSSGALRVDDVSAPALPWPDERPVRLAERRADALLRLAANAVAPGAGQDAADHDGDSSDLIEARVVRAVFLVRAEEPRLAAGDDEEDQEEAGEDGGDDAATGRRQHGTSEPPIIVVTVAHDLAPLDAELRALVLTLLGAGGLLTLAALLLGALSSSRIVGPLARMADAAEAVRAPTDTPPIPVGDSGDEIDRLARALNGAFARVFASWERQRRFAADASHELRTPIAVVRAAAESTLRAPRTAAEYQEALADVLGAATRMQRTVEALLLLARANPGALEASMAAVDLADVARNAAQECAGSATSRGVHVEVVDACALVGESGGAASMVLGNADHLRAIATNLIDNAVRHARSQVGVEVSKRADVVELVVTDDGSGIPADALPHVFERFFRVDAARDAAHGGAGLGLSIVAELAALHGGRAFVRSDGSGATFQVILPCAGPRTPVGAGARAQLHSDVRAGSAGASSSLKDGPLS